MGGWAGAKNIKNIFQNSMLSGSEGEFDLANLVRLLTEFLRKIGTVSPSICKPPRLSCSCGGLFTAD